MSIWLLSIVLSGEENGFFNTQHECGGDVVCSIFSDSSILVDAFFYIIIYQYSPERFLYGILKILGQKYALHYSY